MIILTIREKYGGHYAKKKFLDIDETPPALERSFTTKLERELVTTIEMESKALM